MRQDWINLIRQLAPQYGIDPQAALAVASQEGLSGGVGDGGHAFGPFQLNDAGGVITNRPGNHRAFAESPAGIRWALQQMSSVARGKRGRKAVEAIVSGFERPRDPKGEIDRAVNALAQYRPGPDAQPAPLARGEVATKAQTGLKQAIIQQLLGGGEMNYEALARAKKQDMQRSATRMSPDEPQRPVRGASRPIHGKIIGTPHKGTHTLGNWESDNAVDVAMPEGTPIYAPMAGTIGQQFGSLGSKNPRMAGIRMHLLSPEDELYLAHLSRVAKGIHPGAHVQAGQLLGFSGVANGVPHLHLGARNDDAGSYVG